MTLIDKLNKHKETIAVLRGTEKQGSHVFTFLGHHLLGLQDAIDIVKEHECTWKGVYNHSQESTHYTLSRGIIMKTYTIKQPIFELHEADGWQGKRWYAMGCDDFSRLDDRWLSTSSY